MKVSKLRKAYDERANDDQIIIVDGYEFVPGYLKYLLMWLEAQGAKEITFTKGE